MKKREKKILFRLTLLLLLMIFVVFSAIGCSNQSPAEENTEESTLPSEATEVSDEPEVSGENYVIGIAMDSVADFNVYIVNGFNAFVEENPNYSVEISDANYDISAQITSVENFVTQGVDAIIVKAVDKDGFAPISNLCTENEIPLFVVNTPVISPVSSFIGSNQYDAGVMQAEYIAEQLGEEGNVAILIGDPAHEASEQRTQGVRDTIAKYPNMQIISEQTGYWARDEGISIAENWLQSGMEIDAIIANNDEMALGALIAYKEAGENVLVAGVDGLPDALDSIVAGEMTCSAFQDAYSQAYATMQAASDVLNGKTVETEIVIPYEMITAENVQDYYAKYE